MAAKKKEGSNLVPVVLFKDNGKYKDDVTVGLNGKIWRIKRGETVMVPKEVKEVLDHSEHQDRATSNMITNMEDEYISKERALT